MENEIQVIIGENLKKLRKKRFETVTELADKLGVSQSTISGWENGKIMPRAGAIEKIAAHYKIKKSDLLSPNLGENKQPSNQEDALEDITAKFRANKDKIPPEEFENIKKEIESFISYQISKYEK